MKKLLILGAFLVITLALISSIVMAGPNTPAAEPQKKSFIITMIAKSSTNPVFLSGRKGAEDKAKELSKKLGIDIKIDWRTPPVEDGQVAVP